MTLPALPAEGSTAWYPWATGIDGAARRSTQPLPLVGEWMGHDAAVIGGTRAANGRLDLGAIWLPPGTYDAVDFQLWNPGTVGAVVKVVAYADNNGALGALVVDTAGVDATTNGVKQITGLSIVSPAAGMLLWAGTVSQGAPTTMPELAIVTSGAQQTITAGNNPVPGYVLATAWSLGNVPGAAPTTPSGQVRYPTYTRLGFRRSA